jgi:hypothetical protein
MPQGATLLACAHGTAARERGATLFTAHARTEVRGKPADAGAHALEETRYAHLRELAEHLVVALARVSVPCTHRRIHTPRPQVKLNPHTHQYAEIQNMGFASG